MIRFHRSEKVISNELRDIRVRGNNNNSYILILVSRYIIDTKI